jgi:hypothetical protein
VGGKGQQQPGAAAEQVSLEGLLALVSVARQRVQSAVVLKVAQHQPGGALHCRMPLQVSLLLLHESFAPATPWLLRQAAARSQALHCLHLHDASLALLHVPASQPAGAARGIDVANTPVAEAGRCLIASPPLLACS